MLPVLKACKRCEQLPKFSYLALYGDNYRTHHSITCCTTLTSKTKEEVINKWNNFNAEAKNTFYFNNHTQQWEQAK